MKHGKIKMTNAHPSALRIMEKCSPNKGRFKDLTVGRTKKGFYAELPDGSARSVSMMALEKITDLELETLRDRGK